MLVAIDTETELMTPGNQVPRLVCMSIATSEASALYDRHDAIGAFVALADNGARFVGHNIAYDVLVLLRAEPCLWPVIRTLYDSDRVTDTYLREKLLDVANGYPSQDLSLGGLTGVAKGSDTWRLRYGELIDTPIRDYPPEARDYAIGDAVAAMALHQRQEARAEDLDDQYRLARSALWLRAMSVYGVVCDPSFVSLYERETRAEEARLSEILYAAGLLRRPAWRPRAQSWTKATVDQKAVRARVRRAYESTGRDVPLTDSGRPSYDKLALKKSMDPVLLAQMDRASAIKILGEELPIMQRGCAEPIHARYDELKETGRTGCSKPNLQNRPRRFGAREAFVPRPGYVFAAADFGGLELATMAQVCIDLLGKSTLAEMLNAGIDPHSKMASLILDIPYDVAMRRKEDPDDKEFDSARQTGKVANFSFPGGGGADTISSIAERNYGVIITPDFVRHLKRIWLSTMPEWREYFRLVGRIVETRGKIVQLRSDRVRGGVGFTDGCNTLFQGLGADVFKGAGWRIYCATMDQSSPLFGSHTVLAPHDEFLCEVPEDDRAHDAAIELGRLMGEAGRHWLPDVRLVAQPYLSRRWSKSAKPVRVEGRLVPWELS